MLLDYIRKSWDECIRHNEEDKETLIGLPYPYIVPTKRDEYQEMYYWDTYFTCKGLILSDRSLVAKNCTDNMLYLVEKYGFVPNGNRTYYLSHSQPPVLSMMVMDVYKEQGDREWLSSAYDTLKKEYNFWMTKRITSVGLNKYSGDTEPISYEKLEDVFVGLCQRLKYNFPEKDTVLGGKDAICAFESGWDCTPRTECHESECIYVDLNSLLYVYETNFEKMSVILGRGEEGIWQAAAEKRRNLMNRYMWNKDAFMDYLYKMDKCSSVFSVASLYPLWLGIADDEQAKKTIEKLPLLECEYGISACEKNDVPGVYQWDYPVGWAPLQYITVIALDNYGYREDAVRIAKKYIAVCDKLYEATGEMWEKYSVVTGSYEDASAEYATRNMLGWTAGVYVFLKEYVK